MVWGEKEEFLRTIKPTPKALLTKPELWPWNEWVWEAFMVLCGSRPVGMGPGMIPLSEIEAYGRIHGLPPDEVKDLVFFVQAMDRTFLEEKGDKPK